MYSDVDTALRFASEAYPSCIDVHTMGCPVLLKHAIATTIYTKNNKVYIATTPRQKKTVLIQVHASTSQETYSGLVVSNTSRMPPSSGKLASPSTSLFDTRAALLLLFVHFRLCILPGIHSLVVLPILHRLIYCSILLSASFTLVNLSNGCI